MESVGSQDDKGGGRITQISFMVVGGRGSVRISGRWRGWRGGGGEGWSKIYGWTD